jgi:hypothetical protein
MTATAAAPMELIAHVARLRRAWAMADRISEFRHRMQWVRNGLEHWTAQRLLHGTDDLRTHEAEAEFRERLRSLREL